MTVPIATIAVDVDDVLADHAEDMVSWSNEHYGTRLTIEDYNDHWSEMWQIDHEEVDRRASEYHGTGRHGQFDTKANAQKVLNRLSERFRLVVVTARREEIIEESLSWIDEHYAGIFDEVRFVPIWTPGNTVTKADICREISASYLIDDLPRHCVIAAEGGIKSILFGDYSWNRQHDIPSGVTRCRNWSEVEAYFADK